MSTPPRRPGRPSRPTRTPTSRPRKVAGQARPEPVASEPVAPEPVREPVREPVVLDKAPVDRAEAVVDPGHRRTGSAPSRGALRALAAVVAVLLAMVVAEAWYLVTDRGAEESASDVTPERPVQVPALTVRSVVDQAAKAADLIISATTADYDAEVEAAAATMTDPFAAEFRETKAQVREEFVAQQTQVVVDVSYQGVVSASAEEVKALLFLTQTTQKGSPPEVTPTQYRVTVTMVDTADGWLVSDLQAL